MSLETDLARIADAAASFADEGETLAGVVPAEPTPGTRVYLCAFGRAGDEQTWVVLDAVGHVVSERSLVRETVSIAALCELAVEAAGGGDLTGLRARLVEVREREGVDGVEEAIEALDRLEAALASPPVLATPQRLDAIGDAALRLEAALGGADSPFTRMMRDAAESVQALTADVEALYKSELR